MDAKLFRIPTEPNFYGPLQATTPVVRTHTDNGILPAPDSRFPGWAGPMSDARLVTDYSSHCSKNIPVGKQHPTTLWMQRNADELINYSRAGTAIKVGSIFPFDNDVVPPPIATVSCTRSKCTRTATDAQGGIGIERHESELPELFGTFSSDPYNLSTAPPARTAGTSRYEGGRNSLRGDTPMSSKYY